jgi:N-acetylmuramoyl-L-alanine amidase
MAVFVRLWRAGALGLIAVVALAMSALLAAAPGQAAQPEVLGVRAGRQLDGTRVVVDLSQKVDFKIYTLRDPYRLVVDFPSVGWKINADGVSRLIKDNASIKDFRFGQFGANGGGRIVIELSEPVAVKRSFLLNPIGPHPYRFVLDFDRTDEASFAKQADASKAQHAAAARNEPPVIHAVPPPRKDIDKRHIVVLDPGHGGVDPGAIGVSGNYEKVLTLAMAKELARQLTATGRYKVVLTRTDDRFMALRDRVAFARSAGAELFISIHADSHSDSETRGASVYTLSETGSDREAALLAQKENKADVIAGLDLNRQAPDVQSILIDLAQRETTNRSRVFAGLLVQDLAKAGIPLVQRPNRSAGFAVLTATDVPAALIELGYLSNPSEDRRLRTPGYEQRMARAMVQAIDGFFATLRPGPPAAIVRK